MTKLIFTLLMGCFCIYGFDRMGVISTNGFEPEQAQKQEDIVPVAQAPTRFTDRIAAKNKQL